MCGRGRCTLRPDDVTRACHVTSRPVRRLNMERFRPSYNVAPGFEVPVVRRDDAGDSDGVVLHCMKWGLIPSFTKKTEKADHFKMFNARSESVKEKPAFRRLVPKNRCIVCFEGFYEWKKDGSKKQPYYVHFKDGRPLLFAALYDSWKDPLGELVHSFTILTTSSSSSLKWLHDRMPVILGNEKSTDMWLNDSSVPSLESMLKPYDEADLVWYPVSPAIGKLSFDGPQCVEKVKPEETSASKPISQFFARKEPKLDEGTINEAIDEKKPQINPQTENPTMKEEESDDCDREISVKAEPKTDDDASISPNRVHHNYIPAKREQETKWEQQSAKKKGKGGATDNKQPTLFSYFGKT